MAGVVSFWVASDPGTGEDGGAVTVMTKSHSHSGSKKTPARAHPRGQSPPDGAVYIGLVMIGVFAMVLWYLVFEETWTHGLIGYVIAVAVLVNLYTWRVTQGRRLANWQQSLARLPLRWVGYGIPGGRPLEAAKASARARAMLAVSVATSVVMIVLLTLLLIPK